MAKAAAETALLRAELAHLDGTSVKANKSTSALGDPSGGIEKVSRSSRKGSADLNQYTGRLSALISTAALIGPAILPISAAAIPAISGLSAGLGAAAGAVGVAVLAFNGLGDALKDLDAYQLEPTDENLPKLNQTLEGIGPAGANFVRFLDDLEPELKSLQFAAREGLLPGVQDGIESLLPLLPELREFVTSMSTELGSLTARAGDSLANDADWQKFFQYLQTDGASTMEAFAVATGNVAAGLSSLLRNMAPLTTFFTDGLVDASRSFREWSDGLSGTEGFQEFLAYVRETGPQVADLIEAIGQATLGLIHAMQPVADAVLPALTGLANVIGIIGQSPLGPMLYTTAAGMIALSGAASLTTRTLGLFAASETAAEAATTRLGLALKALPFAAALAAVGPLSSGLNNLWNNVATGDLASQKDIDQIAGNTKSVGWHGNNWLGQSFHQTTKLLPGNDDYDQQQENLGKADRTLADMVHNGQADGAAAKFKQVSDAAREQGATVSQVTDSFPEYTAAVKASGQASESTAAAVTTQTQSLTELTAATNTQKDASLSAFDAETQYREALRGAREQAEKSNAGFKGNSEEVLKNREAISQLASAWNNQDDAVKNNVGRFKKARKELVETAEGLGATKKEAHALAREVMQIPTSIDIKVDANTSAAQAEVRAFAAQWHALHDKTLRLSINSQAAAKYADIHGKADGGRLLDDGLPYGDRVHALLAPSEYVVSNRFGQVDRHLGLLESINANRPLSGSFDVALAAGGPVASIRTSAAPTLEELVR